MLRFVELNVMGQPLEPCGLDPVTGFFRDGNCACGDRVDVVHTVCAVVTAEFLRHQQLIGNDLVTPRPEWGFEGLNPGDRWCVVASRWLQAYEDGVPSPVVLASTNRRALSIVPIEALRENAVDVPDDPRTLC